IDLAFGSATSSGQDSREIINQWLNNESPLAAIEIVDRDTLNGAQGAYAALNNTIYLASEFLIENQDRPEVIESVLLEELGHAFSQELNAKDAPGDEGAIFSQLVQGAEITAERLEQLRLEDDATTITLDGEEIQIEQAREGVNPAFDLIGLTDLRNDPDFEDIDGTGFDVVVIDSGLDATHPLLDDNYQFGFDFIDGDTNPNDLVDHGTHVSGTIGAEDENIGVAPDVGLIGFKVGDQRTLNSFAINDALQTVLDEVTDPNTETNIVAVNLSLGGGFFTRPNESDGQLEIERRRIIRDLEDEGVVVVAAAGNSYVGKPDSNGDIFDASGDVIRPNQEQNLSAPAIYSTIAVGAVWQNNLASDFFRQQQIPGRDRITFFSQRLEAENFLFAPGALITSTVPVGSDDDLLDQQAGTSQASPHVAGAVALLQEIAAEYDVRLTPEQVRDYLIDNADIIEDGDDETDRVANSNIEYPRINIHQSAIALREDLENEDLPTAPVPDARDSVPNDIIDGAVDVALGSDQRPLLFPGSLAQESGRPSNTADVDLFRITVPDDGTLNIDIDTPYADFPDSYLRLFNEAGDELFVAGTNDLFVSDDDLAPGETVVTVDSGSERVVINDPNTTQIVDGRRTADGYQAGNYGHETDSYLSVSVERGQTYYIGVSDFGNQTYDPTNLNNRARATANTGGSYELIATFLNNDVNGTISQVTEDNALPADSFSGTIGSDGNTEIGNKDVDFYRLNSSRAGILEIDVDSFTVDSILDPVDSVITLFDEDGNQIGSNDDIDSLDPRLQFQIEPNRNYYAAITGFGNQDFNPFATGSGTGGSTGEYIINSRLLSASAIDNVSNNTIDSDRVRRVVDGETVTGRIGEDNGFVVGAADIDIFSYVATEDQTLAIRVDATQAFSADTFLRVFDSRGREIDANDDEDSLTRGSFVEIEVEAGREYFIGINGFSANARDYNPITGRGAAAGSQGDYTLAVGDIPRFRPTSSLNALPLNSVNEVSSDDTGDRLLKVNPDTSGSSVYRFTQAGSDLSVYAESQAEKEALQADSNLNLVGVAYNSVDPLLDTTSATPVYHFINQDTGTDFYTISETEKDAVTDLANYTFEGEIFHGYSESEANSIPIHRFYDPTAGIHYFTPLETEREEIATGFPDYQYEGIAFHALPSE
ncbi:MAG: S8 family serine peptidase, partial [Cyanobacteria bacterium J06555_3]